MEEKYIRIQRNDGKLTGKVHILEGEDTKCKLFRNYRTPRQQKGLTKGPITTNGSSYHEVDKTDLRVKYCCGACFKISRKKKKKRGQITDWRKVPQVKEAHKVGTPRTPKNNHRWHQ
jgi:hypothetical protein